MTVLDCLRDDEQPKRAHGEDAHEQALTTGHERWFCCGRCGTRIAPATALLPEREAPLVFANPHGLVFELVLFGRAQALRLVGSATQEFTWFPGYAWRVALCTGCGLHLGWRFESAGGGSPALFFALLRRELVEQDDIVR